MGQNNLFMVGDVKQGAFTGSVLPARAVHGKNTILYDGDSENQKIEAAQKFPMGIPAITPGREKSGYFSALEVPRTVLSFLRVLDNPRQDIPFTAVLTSPIGTFATEELAKIRTENPEVSYYEACRAYENAGSDGF